MKQYWQFWLAICLFAAWPCFSQERSDSIPMQELEEVVVSDTRFPLKREQSGKTVIRLGAEELAAYRGQTLASVLNQQSGFEISGSRGRPGEVLGVFARLYHRDGKDAYLQDMPLVMNYLRKACERYRELHSLLKLLDELVCDEPESKIGYTF